MNKIALVTGIGGQDGSYLAELLLSKGYEVHGIVRRSSSQEQSLYRIAHILDKITLHEGDITDSNFVKFTIMETFPDEIYNLAAQSHVHTSFDIPDYTFRVNTLGLLNILECAPRNTKIYQASTSEMFGGSFDRFYNEHNEFFPRSPYAVSKVAAHHLAEIYRKMGQFIACGIMFNHESPRRGDNFVTKKIAKAAARAYLNIPYKLELGNLSAIRDWGFAPDYVEVMWKMLQQDGSHTYVIGTGDSHTVQGFLDAASTYIGKKIDFSISDKFLRPREVDSLQCDTFSAYRDLDWKAKTQFDMLVKIMVDAEISRLSYGVYNGWGYAYFEDHYSSIYRWL